METDFDHSMPPLEGRRYFVDLSCCNMIAEKAAAGPNVAQPNVKQNNTYHISSAGNPLNNAPMVKI